MKNGKIHFNLLAILAVFIITSCGSPIHMTSSVNQNDKSKISKVVIMPLFERIEYLRPFEQSVCAYFNEQGLKSIGSLDFLNPSIKYPISEIKQKCDSLGADAIIVFSYLGTDKTESYVPGTTYVAGSFGGYWGGGYYGGGYYGHGIYYTGTTSGYWATTSVVNLKASVYTHASKDPLWTAEIKVTDPKYVDEAAVKIARYIYSDWKTNNLLKSPQK